VLDNPILISGGLPCLPESARHTPWKEDDCSPIILNFRQDQEGEPVTAQRPKRSGGPADGGLTGEGAQLPLSPNCRVAEPRFSRYTASASAFRFT